MTKQNLVICDHAADPDCPLADCPHKKLHERNDDCDAGCMVGDSAVIISKCIEV